MTTNAVHALPGEVLFHVEVMRQEMKTIKTAPLEEEMSLLFEKASKAAEQMAAQKDM
jgi:hypothetical protein